MDRAPILVNGRFLTQKITGVQRFSLEVVSSLDTILGSRNGREVELLVPRSWADRATYQRIKTRRVGRASGQVWEQIELPWQARGHLLLNLGNTAPIIMGCHQLVVVHDAGVFDTPESYSRAFGRWYKLLQRRLVEGGAHIVTVSEFSRQRIAAHLPIDPSRITVVSEGSDHILRPQPDWRVLEKHGLGRGRFALVVGSLGAHKNLNLLQGAALMLNRRGLQLVVAGSFNPVNRPEDTKLNFPIRAIGRVSDAELRALYHSALCLLFPSRYEGFGLPPIEAMTCDCPVLASVSGSVQEVCGDAAMYFSANAPESPVAALTKLIEEPALRTSLCAAGRLRASGFTWDAVARKLLTVAESIADC